MATEPVVLTEDPRGRALRFHGLDLHSPGPSWDVPSGIQMVHEAGDDGVGCHRLVLPYVPEKWGSWAIASDHTIPVAPNRNYLLFALIDCDFERPAEINLGLRQIDGGGKYVMYRMNGILNNTCGWSRWEWEVTTDPQAAHVMFGIDFYPMAVGGPEVFSQGGRFRIADVALIELPPKELTPYARGKGATFRGGPGNLPMRVLDARQRGEAIEVRTTGARFTFDLDKDTILAEQLVEREREVCFWRSSLPLKGLAIISRDEKVCLLGNDGLTLGVQCDSLLMVVPHDELRLQCESKIGGRWNRYACGHLLVRDDFGGFAVNPDVPAGTGRLARTNIDQMPGWLKAGGIDFSGKINDMNSLSTADPGWTAKWHLSPGERLGISIFPPRPFPWEQSFRCADAITHRRVDPESHKRFSGLIDIMVMWDFLARSWAMSYGREHVAIDDEVTRRHIEAIKEAGIAPLLYMSGWFYYSRDAVEFAEEVKRVRDRYQTAGVYLDGLPTEWVTAYEEIRLIREIFPDGLILLHHTCPAPLMEASIELPAVASYVDSTNMAELIYGKGKDWAYPKYFVSQYRKANTVGTMIHDHWDYGGRGDRDVMMLRYNGRAFAPGLPWETGIEDDTFAEWVGRYLSAIEELKTLWEEKGDDAEFYERYYLPKVLELTDQDLPEA